MSQVARVLAQAALVGAFVYPALAGVLGLLTGHPLSLPTVLLFIVGGTIAGPLVALNIGWPQPRDQERDRG